MLPQLAAAGFAVCLYAHAIGSISVTVAQLPRRCIDTTHGTDNARRNSRIAPWPCDSAALAAARYNGTSRVGTRHAH